MDYINWAEEYEDTARMCETALDNLYSRLRDVNTNIAKDHIRLKIIDMVNLKQECLHVARSLRKRADNGSGGG